MEELFGISVEWVILIGVNFFLILILFIINLSNRSKIKKLKNKYYKFMNGLSSTNNIEDVVFDCIEKVNGVIGKTKELDYQLNSVERNMYYCLQKVSVIRYNAFDNVGSDLSFSIALLNNNDDGLVISSLYSRETSSTYAKPVVGGKSKYALSAEEIKAIDSAVKTHVSSKYTE